MIRLVNLEEIQKEIIQISRLITLQQQQDFSFDARAKLWLKNLESILENNHMIQAGEIAALRGAILSAEDGIIPPGIEFYNKPTKRKIVEAATSFALRQAGSILSEAVQEDIRRINEAERIMQQLIALAKSKGLFQDISDNIDNTESLKAIWQALAADPDIAPGTISVEGLVGPYDALIILDRAITSDRP